MLSVEAVKPHRKDWRTRWRAGLPEGKTESNWSLDLQSPGWGQVNMQPLGTFLHEGLYLVDVLDMVDLGTLGGETDVECGVLLAVEREKNRGRR